MTDPTKPPEPPGDADAFESAMRGVVRRRATKQRVGPKKRRRAAEPDRTPAPSPAAAPEGPSPAFVRADRGTGPEGRVDGVSLATMRRLRRGRLPVERCLDLHGLTRAAARSALETFIDGSHQEGVRAVLVVTGVGRGNPDQTGVLRREVPDWLSCPPLADRVLAYCSARRADGGQGALYVLLRR